ncbi:helix-turn-helix domain-containing protein [Paenibacillus sp. GCM10027628]|uniref:helix-turn-helix domain-containing protein n=1 Tax=Paenibacillus sp. GCM10027628 TaxID=3273413 RepID=UPI00363E7F53
MTRRHISKLAGKNLFQEGMRIHVNRNEEGFQLDYHEHDFFEIVYVLSGKGYHHIHNEVFPVTKGDLFFIPVGTSHVFRPYTTKREDKLIVYNCLFTESLLDEITELIPEFQLKSLLLENSEIEGYLTVRDRRLTLESTFQRMHEEHTFGRPGSSTFLFALLLELLIELARHLMHCPQIDVFAAEKTDDPIGQALAYMQNHPAENFTLQSMAEKYQLSERHFFRLFKARIGQSFHAYLQQCRIRLSCELLRGTPEKIDSIASMVGYRDTQSFYRVFKRIVGLTPGDYRKTNK